MPAVRKIGKYQVLDEIGRGTFSVVYKCRHPFLERSLAIKVCETEDPDVLQRFSSEAQIASGLDHRNIVRVFDYGVTEEGPYLVEELLEGEDLEAKIELRTPISYLERIGILIQIAQGLAYAHSQGVLHRDVSPSNVRVLDDGLVKIMDFGIARLVSSDVRTTKAGSILGTAGYLPPEQVLGKATDERSDIFSFGALAYHLLSYERPFPGESLKELLRGVLKVEPPLLSTQFK